MGMMYEPRHLPKSKQPVINRVSCCALEGIAFLAITCLTSLVHDQDCAGEVDGISTVNHRPLGTDRRATGIRPAHAIEPSIYFSTNLFNKRIPGQSPQAVHISAIDRRNPALFAKSPPQLSLNPIEVQTI